MKALLMAGVLASVAFAVPAAEAKNKVSFDIVIGVPGAPMPYPPPYEPRYPYEPGYPYQPGYPDYSYQEDYLGPQILGETRLGRGSDSDYVRIDSCAQGLTADAVQLRVKRNSAQIDYVAITLENGRRIRLDVRNFFQAGSSSRWIPLNGQRCIRSFQVVGETAGPGPKAVVRLIGNTYRF